MAWLFIMQKYPQKSLELILLEWNLRIQRFVAEEQKYFNLKSFKDTLTGLYEFNWQMKMGAVFHHDNHQLGKLLKIVCGIATLSPRTHQLFDDDERWGGVLRNLKSYSRPDDIPSFCVPKFDRSFPSTHLFCCVRPANFCGKVGYSSRDTKGTVI